jgi:hypothetical protein
MNGDSHIVTTVTLRWKWNLIPKYTESDNQRHDEVLELPSPTEPDLIYLGQGYEHRLKTELITKWSRWIVEDMNSIRSAAAQNDCHHTLADAASNEARWELTTLDTMLAWEWTRRELLLLVFSIKLEDKLHKRREECIEKVAEERRNGRSKEWIRSELKIGRQKRLEGEREKMKERMEKEMKAASERAEREGRPWIDQRDYSPQGRWEDGLNFVNKQWSTGIPDGYSVLWDTHATRDLARVIERKTMSSGTRRRVMEQIGQRCKHWYPQREIERREMNATIRCIGDAETTHLDNAYRYPEPDRRNTRKFVKVGDLHSHAKFCSATVYDAKGCDEDEICDIIKKSTTRSVIGVHPDLLDSIPENDHLLYISSSGGKEPSFIQRNRDRWWDQHTSNASSFYFSPQRIYEDRMVTSRATIAHIFVFLETPSNIRLSLLHWRWGDTSVSIQENDSEHRRISSNEIPEDVRQHDFDLNRFEPGNHELELVVMELELGGEYFLRDILIEFFDDPSSTDNDSGNVATISSRGVEMLHQNKSDYPLILADI